MARAGGQVLGTHASVRRRGGRQASTASFMSSFNLSRAIPRWRFSLGGLLLLMLSISVGLAMWRLPGATGAQFLYGCFGSWFVVGMIQRARRAWKLAPNLNSFYPSFR